MAEPTPPRLARGGLVGEVRWFAARADTTQPALSKLEADDFATFGFLYRACRFTGSAEQSQRELNGFPYRVHHASGMQICGAQNGGNVQVRSVMPAAQVTGRQCQEVRVARRGRTTPSRYRDRRPAQRPDGQAVSGRPRQGTPKMGTTRNHWTACRGSPLDGAGHPAGSEGHVTGIAAGSSRSRQSPRPTRSSVGFAPRQVVRALKSGASGDRAHQVDD